MDLPHRAFIRVISNFLARVLLLQCNFSAISFFFYVIFYKLPRNFLPSRNPFDFFSPSLASVSGINPAGLLPELSVLFFVSCFIPVSRGLWYTCGALALSRAAHII